MLTRVLKALPWILLSAVAIVTLGTRSLRPDLGLEAAQDLIRSAEERAARSESWAKHLAE